ncbi:MAG: ABC transporter substrate-binding protein, partial [Phototrophicaceae bacterium]
EGIDPASVNVVPRTSFGVEQLTSGQVDGLVGWIINEGITLREAAYDPVVLLMNNYRVATYDFVIFTAEDFATQHPQQVKAFLQALRAGLEDVIANPAQAVTDLLEVNPALDPVAQERRLVATLPLMTVPDQSPLSMDYRVWEFTHQTLLNQGLLETPLDVYFVYTLDFLTADS